MAGPYAILPRQAAFMTIHWSSGGCVERRPWLEVHLGRPVHRNVRESGRGTVTGQVPYGEPA